METALDAIHLLAAAVWVGGSVALVFVGVPVVRTLEGEARTQALRRLGRRWRPIGYGSLAVAAVTGLFLADDHRHDSLLWAKVAVVALLVAFSALHDFVLNPRLAREVREGRPKRTLPALIAVGWLALALTLAAPVLGVVLAHR